MPYKRLRAMCFTWHKGRTSWHFKYDILDIVDCEYIVWQEEVGNETEARHIQGT